MITETIKILYSVNGLCVCCHWGRWSFPSAPPVMAEAVILATYPVWLMKSPCIHIYLIQCLNTLSPRQDGCLFADDILKCIFLHLNSWIPNKISWKYVASRLIDNKPSMVQKMGCRRAGDNPIITVGQRRWRTAVSHLPTWRPPKQANKARPGLLFYNRHTLT